MVFLVFIYGEVWIEPQGKSRGLIEYSQSEYSCRLPIPTFHEKDDICYDVFLAVASRHLNRGTNLPSLVCS